MRLDDEPCAVESCPRKKAIGLTYCDMHEWRHDHYDGPENFLTQFLKR